MSRADLTGLPRDARQGQRFFGKYRGKVMENVDPLFLGRIIPDVPSVSGSVMNWAMPCTPYAGDNVGFYAIPPIGANVWIEFEGGDPNYPIWSGCFWAPDQVPKVPEPPPPEVKVFKTEFITMVLSDVPEEGGFTLQCEPAAVNTPLTMLFNSEGITLLCPEATIQMTPESIELTVPESVVTIAAEAIELTVPPSSQDMTAEAVSIESPDVSVTAEGAVEVSAGGDVSIDAGGAAETTAGSDAAMTAGGAVEVTSGGDVSMPQKRQAMTWAQRLKRVFRDFD